MSSVDTCHTDCMPFWTMQGHAVLKDSTRVDNNNRRAAHSISCCPTRCVTRPGSPKDVKGFNVRRQHCTLPLLLFCQGEGHQRWVWVMGAAAAAAAGNGFGTPSPNLSGCAIVLAGRGAPRAGSAAVGVGHARCRCRERRWGNVWRRRQHAGRQQRGWHRRTTQ